MDNRDLHIPQKASFEVKIGLAEMLKGGAIFEVRTVQEAKMAEEGGAVAVTLHKESLVVEEVQEAISIPVMGKVRVGHFVEAQILEALFVDFIDENSELGIVDRQYFIDKEKFDVPFVCGASDLGEALRRIAEGAAMIRSEGNGSMEETVAIVRAILSEIRRLTVMDEAELFAVAEQLSAPLSLVKKVATSGILPVPLFASGGIITPADAALMMQLGAESIFVGSEIFEMKNPKKQIKMLVSAVQHFHDPALLAKVSMGLSEAMTGSTIGNPKKEEAIANRSW